MTTPLSDSHVERLAKLLLNDQLVLFVGAGISHQAKARDGSGRRLPLWRELGEQVAAQCGEQTGNYSQNILDLFDAIETNQSRGQLEEAVRNALPDNEFEPSPMHAALARLPWHMVYTTNYDNLLIRALNETEPIDDEIKYELLQRDQERRPRLVHLHGTLQRIRTLTGNDFSRWSKKNPVAYNYLQHIALNRAILFVGYSFSDPHLKYGLLPWVKEITQGRGRRHYAWIWEVSPEQARLLDKRDQIEVIPIRSDSDWEAAVAQLAERVQAASRKPQKARKRSTVPAIPDAEPDDEVVINGYKLFYHRTRKQMSLRHLSIATAISVQMLNNLEQVKVKLKAGPNCFGKTTRSNVTRLEHALGCPGELAFGKNDFLAAYILFYKVNRKQPARMSVTKQIDFAADTKAVVFDFGGTLTRATSPVSTWERMWTASGYTIQDAGHYHRQFIAGNLSHQQWCDATCERFRKGGFSRAHLKSIIDGIEPVVGLHETLAQLHDQGISLHVVSGSVKEIILSVLGNSARFFDEIKANEFVWDADGIIKEIRGHQFDFEGKARFITRVIEDRSISPLEVLFVGNSLNDSWASQSGARTLCVNPTHVDYSNTLLWTDYIKDMTNLSEILPFARRTTGS